MNWSLPGCLFSAQYAPHVRPTGHFPVVDPAVAFHGSCVAGPLETRKLRQGVLNVKTFLSRATVVAIALAICLVNLEVSAQQAPHPSGTSVAVIDMVEVFKGHPRLKSQLEGLKSQMDAYEAEVRQQQQKVQSLAEQLKTLRPGSETYAATEKQYATLQADLAVQLRQKQREFLEKEAQLRYQAYQDVQQVVERFCKTYGIQLVIRFSRAPIDPAKPQEVMMGVSRPIVYQDRLDITGHIIGMLNPEGQSRTNTATNTQIPPRPQR